MNKKNQNWIYILSFTFFEIINVHIYLSSLPEIVGQDKHQSKNNACSLSITIEAYKIDQWSLRVEALLWALTMCSNKSQNWLEYHWIETIQLSDPKTQCSSLSL